MWHTGLAARDRTCVPCIGRWILNHCTTREVPIFLIKKIFLFFVIVLPFFFFFSCCASRLAGSWLPGWEVRLELLWWEHRVQTAGLTENLRPQGILTGVKPPGGPPLGTKTWLYPTACKLQCWRPKAKQPVRQEYSPTHQKKKN